MKPTEGVRGIPATPGNGHVGLHPPPPCCAWSPYPCRRGRIERREPQHLRPSVPGHYLGREHTARRSAASSMAAHRALRLSRERHPALARPPPPRPVPKFTTQRAGAGCGAHPVRHLSRVCTTGTPIALQIENVGPALARLQQHRRAVPPRPCRPDLPPEIRRARPRAAAAGRRHGKRRSRVAAGAVARLRAGRGFAHPRRPGADGRHTRSTARAGTGRRWPKTRSSAPIRSPLLAWEDYLGGVRKRWQSSMRSGDRAGGRGRAARAGRADLCQAGCRHCRRPDWHQCCRRPWKSATVLPPPHCHGEANADDDADAATAGMVFGALTMPAAFSAGSPPGSRSSPASRSSRPARS